MMDSKAIGTGLNSMVIILVLLDLLSFQHSIGIMDNTFSISHKQYFALLHYEFVQYKNCGRRDVEYN